MWHSNPHSTGRLNLATLITDVGKIMLSVFTKYLRIETLSTSGEFIRWSGAVRPTNGETVPSLVAGSAQAPPNPHWNGKTK